MIEGFWVVQFEGVAGNGGGVVIFTKGHVIGGDSGYIYTGTYESKSSQINAMVDVRNFLPDVPSVLGITGDFKLSFKGVLADRVITGSAALIGQPGVGIAVRLTKVSDLPL